MKMKMKDDDFKQMFVEIRAMVIARRGDIVSHRNLRLGKDPDRRFAFDLFSLQ